MNTRIKIKVLKIDPESTYNGKNFGCFLTIELKDGTIIPVMDYSNRTDKTTVNKEMTVLLSISPTDPVMKSRSSSYFIQALTFENQKTGHWVKINGLIENDDATSVPYAPKEFQYFCVNVGTGNILLQVDKDSSIEFRTGDVISTIGIASLIDI